MARESPLYVKTYDLLAFLLPRAEQFRRSQRLVLGRRLQEVGLRFLDLILEARKSPAEGRRELLRLADVELDKLRYTVRLCHALDLLALSHYRRASELLAEVGKLLGTWIKGYNG